MAILVYLSETGKYDRFYLMKELISDKAQIELIKIKHHLAGEISKRKKNGVN